MLIDSHTHIYAEEFDEDFEAMLQRAEEAGVVQFVLPNTDVESWERMLPLCERYPNRLFLTIGLHPTYIKEDYKEQLATLETLLPQAHVYAIGEIGLADSLDLPVILHIREAFADAFKVLRELNLPKLRGVFHSFTGTQEELEEALSFSNFYVGINGVLTFKNSNLKDYITLIPQERLLIETDAPYLAPVPKRGKRNEPSFLPYTLSFLASCYEMSDEKLMHITSDNARRLFHLPTR